MGYFSRLYQTNLRTPEVALICGKSNLARTPSTVIIFCAWVYPTLYGYTVKL